MCLLAFAVRATPRYPLILIGNRDELHSRPALPAHWWRSPRLLAGKDLTAGGTWLGMTREGRVATVTNYRDPEQVRAGAPSRGHLVLDALTQGDTVMEEELRRGGPDYNGFNLLWGDARGIRYYHNQNASDVSVLDPGVYGLSNGLLDTPWPKLVRARDALARSVANDECLTSESLFPILEDRRAPPEHTLPDTGIDPEWERLLSTAFICSPAYGTRASTVILMERDGRAVFHERTYDADGVIRSDRKYAFRRTA